MNMKKIELKLEPTEDYYKYKFLTERIKKDWKELKLIMDKEKLFKVKVKDLSDTINKINYREDKFR